MSDLPKGKVQLLILGGESAPLRAPTEIALDLKPFEIPFTLIAKAGDKVKKGAPILADKNEPRRLFVSPAAGTITEVRRGLKRVLQEIVIALDSEEEEVRLPPLNPNQVERAALLTRLLEGGAFAHIRNRPFNFLANPDKTPRSIFIQAVESAPCVPPAEMQIEGEEKAFQAGLNTLCKLTDGPVHLVYHAHSSARAFKDAQGVQKHTVEGPHPISAPSLHIQVIDRIQSPEDVIWSLNAHDVVMIGKLVTEGIYWTDRIIGIGGNGMDPHKIGYFKVRAGFPIRALISGRLAHGTQRRISGDPLIGHQVSESDFLGFNDYAFTVIPENTHRQFLHFFRLGADKYSCSGAYLSGHLQDRFYDFTTSLHGEHRPFIDSTLYQKVQPLQIPTMLLCKAVLAEDYDRAAELGLYEVVPEDFALTTFVDPSKIDMPGIIRKGLREYAKEVLG